MRQMELINLLYRPELLQELMEDLTKTPGYCHFFETDPQLAGEYRFKDRITLAPDTMLKINELSMQMYNEQQTRKTGWQFMMKMLFMQILCIICRTFEQHSSQSNETQEITQIIRYLNDHYPQKLTLEKLAARFGKSVPTLSRLFQATLNRSPIAYDSSPPRESRGGTALHLRFRYGHRPSMRISRQQLFFQNVYEAVRCLPRDYRKQGRTEQ